MTDLFDHRQVRRSFSRAAHGYDGAAALQREVGARLSETLEYLDDRAPEVVVDIGCGPGHLSAAMQKRWPRAQVIALDLALPMLREARGHFGDGGWRPRLLGGARRPDPVCADARALPFAPDFFDAIVSIDSFPYYGTDDLYLAYLARYLRRRGSIRYSGAVKEVLDSTRSSNP